MISRRSLLRSAGLGAAAAPFVPLLQSHAQPGAHPLRIVFVFEYHGGWRPSEGATGGETDFVLNEATRSLEPLRDELILIDGLDYTCIDVQDAGQDHHALKPSVLTGQLTNINRSELEADGGGPSVDQIIANRIGSTTAFPSTYIAIDDPGGLIWSGPGSRYSADRGVRAPFEALFGDFRGPTESRDVLAERRGSILDAVNGDLNTLLQRVSGHDRLKVQAHLESLRSLEQRVHAPPTSCAAPAIDDGDLRDKASAANDLVTAAFSCDLTRVAVIHYDKHSVPWISDAGHHGLTHDTTDEELRILIEYDKWYVSQFAALCQQLQSIPEGAGTMLDNTICVWCQEQILAQEDDGGTDTHNPYNVPWMIVGGRNAGLRGGRKLDFGGHPHNDLLVSLCQLMGLSDVTTVGLPQLCNGGLSGLV